MQRPSVLVAIAAAVTLAGSAVLWRPDLEVIDGDTVRHGFWTWRMANYDTPEIARAQCAEERARGEDAKAMLAELIRQADGRWQLLPVARVRDQFGRRLARLELAGTDAGELLIRAALAQPYDGGRRTGWCPPGPKN